MKCLALGVALAALAWGCGSGESEQLPEDPVVQSGDVPAGDEPAEPSDTGSDSDDEPPETGVVALMLSGETGAPGAGCGEEFIDHGCDAVLPLVCGQGNLIGFDTPDAPCPTCQPASDVGIAANCDVARIDYAAFFAQSISLSCANWCESDDDCIAFEITNNCGTVALALTGGIDEEPVFFAQEFSRTRCAACSEGQEIEQREFARRSTGEWLGGESEGHSGLLTHTRPRCVERQCVLVSEDW